MNEIYDELIEKIDYIIFDLGTLNMNVKAGKQAMSLDKADD